MRLSEWVPVNTELVRDGAFSSTGPLYAGGREQLVWASTERDIAKIAANPSISCVITTPGLASTVGAVMGILATPDPQSAFYILHGSLRQIPGFALPPFKNRISPSATIHPSARIAPASVAIGDDVIIGKNVVIHEQSVIDKGSIVRPNSIIGCSPGIPGCVVPGTRGLVDCACGGVHLHHEVDIHANTCIFRALFPGWTEIGEQTKIDNLDFVGQGTRIGDRCLICAGVRIEESVCMGDDGWIGPNVSLEQGIAIGRNVYITIGSSVTQDVGDDKVVKDNFVLDRRRFQKVMRGM